MIVIVFVAICMVMLTPVRKTEGAPPGPTQSMSPQVCYEDPMHIANAYHRGSAAIYQNPPPVACPALIPPVYSVILTRSDPSEFFPYVGLSLTLKYLPAGYQLTGITFSGIGYGYYQPIQMYYSTGCDKLTPVELGDCIGCVGDYCNVEGLDVFNVFGYWPNMRSVLTPMPPGAESLDLLFLNVPATAGNFYFGNFEFEITNLSPPYDVITSSAGNHICDPIPIPVFECSCPNCCLTCS